MEKLKLPLVLLWACPWTLVGMGVGLIGLATGGRVQRRGRVIEFYGGGVAWLLDRFPVQPLAMTVGHTVLGMTAAALDICRDHELVHVRQYERWGPFFVPAYLACSVALLLKGRDAYRENPFEQEAWGSHRD